MELGASASGSMRARSPAATTSREGTMKIGRLFVAALLAVSVSSFSFAEDKKPEKKYAEGSCCAKAQAKGEACKHPCCVKAEEGGTVCEKCNKAK